MSTKNQTCLPDWYYKGEIYNPDFPVNYYGFIYLLEYDNGMKYIGKKSFWKTKTLPPLKGKKRKRRSMVESDWRTYTGSSKEIPTDVKLLHRDILVMANGKQHLSYMEENFLHRADVPLSEEYFNKNIAGRYFDNVDRKVGEWIKYYEKELNDR